MTRMVKKGKIFLCCAVVVFGAAFWGCTQKEEEAEEKEMPAIEAPAPEMGATEDEQPMAPAEEGEETEGDMTEEKKAE